MSRHKLRYDVANYLANVVESNDWKEYENHKVNLQKICLTEFEYEKAIKCLTDIMGI